MPQGVESYKAVVEKIIQDGRHGPYAVAYSEAAGKSLTFSLDSKVWQDDELPELGTWVMLSKITRKSAGWRAGCGRLFRLSDEKQDL